MIQSTGLALPSQQTEPLKLDKVLTMFFLMRTNVRDEKTREHYRRAVRWLGEMLGREATTADLKDENLACLMKWLEMTRNQGASTVNGTHKCICSLWRWCRDRDLVRGAPTVRAIRVPRRTPRAYTQGEMERLVVAAAQTVGTICGLPASVWWLTLIQLEINTGVRATEMFHMRWENMNWETGWITVPAEFRKGKIEDGAYGLWPQTVEWLARFRRKNGPIVPFPKHHTGFYRMWNDLLEKAGLPTGRRTKMQALRRTFATIIDANGGDASKALGHTDPTLAGKHYIDPTAGEQRKHADVVPDKWRPLSMAISAATKEAKPD
jgi:integrase